jgi:hypothetical protein
MKTLYTVMAAVASLAFTVTIVLANPAMMKKHEGYPSDDGKGTTATGAAALEKAAADAPKELKEQTTSATGGQTDSLKRGEARSLPTPTGPGYVGKGVTEDHIKDATKVNAEPK